MITAALTPTITLNNGLSMPQLGLGVWQASDAEAEQAVLWALQAGYRLIDTASLYGNEAGVGRAVRGSGLPRTDIFITTKLWNTDQGYAETLRAFDASMERLGLDYVDLYLIHWPMPTVNKFAETWKAFEKLYKEKRVRAIGVSNFGSTHLKNLLAKAKVKPAVNQIELHPYFQQAETRETCKQNGIAVEAWSPLGGKGALILDDPHIIMLSEKHGRTPAQIAIRWHIQMGFVVIPKSVHQERIQENASVFDFVLDDEDMQTIAGLERNRRLGPDPATFGAA